MRALKNLKRIFINADWNDIKQMAIRDVLIPGAKRMIYDLGRYSIMLVLYGTIKEKETPKVSNIKGFTQDNKPVYKYY